MLKESWLAGNPDTNYKTSNTLQTNIYGNKWTLHSTHNLNEGRRHKHDAITGRQLSTIFFFSKGQTRVDSGTPAATHNLDESNHLRGQIEHQGSNETNGKAAIGQPSGQPSGHTNTHTHTEEQGRTKYPVGSTTPISAPLGRCVLCCVECVPEGFSERLCLLDLLFVCLSVSACVCVSFSVIFICLFVWAHARVRPQQIREG